MSAKNKLVKSSKIMFGIMLQLMALLFSGLVLFLIYAMFGMPSYNWSSSEIENPRFKVYLRSNGMHTDICFPIKTDQFNWWTYMDSSDFPKENYQWLAIGWGDKDFYIETPTWDEVTFGNLTRSLFLPTESAMHVEMLYSAPTLSEDCKEVNLDETGFLNISNYAKESFVMDDQKFNLIEGATYFGRDRFYNAKGQYHFLETCNSWTNGGLKSTGVKTASWALFPKTILAYSN